MVELILVTWVIDAADYGGTKVSRYFDINDMEASLRMYTGISDEYKPISWQKIKVTIQERDDIEKEHGIQWDFSW